VQSVKYIIAGATLLWILFFLIYVAGLFRLPTGTRPKTPVFNRFGDSLPPRQNPGYQETEDEQESGRD
jgi:hypothetical protein